MPGVGTMFPGFSAGMIAMPAIANEPSNHRPILFAQSMLNRFSYRALIASEADRKAPRKQRHTAHRIWKRIEHEMPDCKIGSPNLTSGRRIARAFARRWARAS